MTKAINQTQVRQLEEWLKDYMRYDPLEAAALCTATAYNILLHSIKVEDTPTRYELDRVANRQESINGD